MEVVNGYPCKNCTDVELAKKGIDPAKPKDGPEGAYAADGAQKTGKPGDKPDASGKPKPPGQFDGPADRGPAVTFGGDLAELVKQTAQTQASQTAVQAQAVQQNQAYQTGRIFSFNA